MPTTWSAPVAGGGQEKSVVESFDDTPLAANAYIVGMTIWIRQWGDHPVWGGFSVTYSNGVTVQHGGSDCGSQVHEFRLVQGEVINDVEIRSGHLLDQMTFRTNRGRVCGPYGGSGGCKVAVEYSPYHRTSAARRLACVKGDVVSAGGLAVNNLQLLWTTC